MYSRELHNGYVQSVRLSPGDIVLAYSSRLAASVRPFLVVGIRGSGYHVIPGFHPDGKRRSCQVVLDPFSAYAAGLQLPTSFRFDLLASVEQRLIVRRLGRLTERSLKEASMLFRCWREQAR